MGALVTRISPWVGPCAPRSKTLFSGVLPTTPNPALQRTRPPRRLPWEAEHLAFRVVSLDQAIAVEQDSLALLQLDLLLLIGHPRHQPQRHTPRPKLVCLPIMP